VQIVVAVKPVPEAEARLRATADGRTLDPEGTKFVLAGYDESAVEQALLLKEANAPSSVTAISAGPAARCEEVLRACLALGCDRAVLVESSDLGSFADPMAAARALAAGLQGEKVDLLLFGKHAGDDEESIVGAAVAQTMGLAHVGFATDLRFDAATSRFVFRRSVERGEERWQAPVPLAVSLQQAWNDPRTAKLPAILKSRKMPIARAAAPPPASEGGSSAGTSFALPAPRTGAKMIEYRTPEEAAQKLVRILREEAKVFP
jgi:electron transfer flavoprotein beta subunit